MLIIDNGAFKSGSSWLFKILKQITNFEPIPQEYQNPGWYHPSIDPKKLQDFLKNGDYSTKNYLSKNHFSTPKQRDLILQNSNVLVVGITRDIKDVVVSAYYHFSKSENDVGNFTNYYWKRGRRVVNDALKYNSVWSIESPKIYISSYEILKNDSFHEIDRIAKFLEFDLSQEKINQIVKETSFKEISKSGNKHFRKGEIGDWQNHLSQGMHRDVKIIEEKGLENLSFLDKSIAKITYFYEDMFLSR